MHPLSAPEPAERTILDVPIDLIDKGPADEQRVTRDEVHLQTLAVSMARIGVLTPIILRKQGERYETVAGSYRREAARIAGLKTIPAEVLECDDDRAWEISCTENTHRAPLTVVEEAESIRAAHTKLHQDMDQIAAAWGRSRAWVEDRLGMLNWDPILLQQIHHGNISKAAAAPLARIEDPELRRLLLTEAISHGATARATANWAETAKRQALAGTPLTAEDITTVGGPPLQRLLVTCWLCTRELENKHMSYLPACPICIEGVQKERDQRERADYALNDATAVAHSSAETPA